ncbi:D-glycero-beta-D-manno-heptose 1,7-bisphosphate 7-phosphatase [Sedimenticola sp.]|uniref:D-glycero-beta-D-manno-heptose 1,7-bisphosphate 7-phosphatase n=1 Tax=Sedimenticola sp. TaxID=1940285 RepID=UPI00258ADFCD|nr:D-glycero-beta-D-manno-heptose 1,7-bisphosphate 7-phosphatase [Sedimenticola sp.]MCW8905589.1 D-glycero-beta-D-manno-heptose 1,7-bisphosphate 7-phosphatase [Sedimenticola sp.]
MHNTKLIILDRDGVINEDSDTHIKSPDEWIPIPGSLTAIAKLNQAGYRVVIATNQSGLARGLFKIDTLNAIHSKMNLALASEGGRIDGLFFCPHGPKAGCDCRKPKPGLLLQIADRFYTSLEKVPCIGDSLRDLRAATAVGARPILVRTGKGAKTEADPKLDPTIPIYDNLSDAVAELLKQEE